LNEIFSDPTLIFGLDILLSILGFGIYMEAKIFVNPSNVLTKKNTYITIGGFSGK
jgi:hypothetical protein